MTTYDNVKANISSESNLNIKIASIYRACREIGIISKIFIIGQLMDILTTTAFLSMGMEEANIIYQHYGWAVQITLKIFVSFLIVLMMEKVFLDHIYFKIWKWIFCAVTWAAPLWNIYWMIIELF